MDGELNETTSNMYSSVWGSTPHTVYEATTSTNITNMSREMDLYQGRPHSSWKTVQREKEREECQKQSHNEKRPRRQEPQWEQQWQPPEGQRLQKTPPWLSSQRRELQRKQPRQLPQHLEVKNKPKSSSTMSYRERRFQRSREKRENKLQKSANFGEKPKCGKSKLPDPIPHTTNSALTWAEAVSSLSIEDPNAVYDPSEPTITEFDIPHEDPLLPLSITDTVDVLSPYLEVAIVSVPATDLTRERSALVELKIADLAEEWAANSNHNVAIALIASPMYSEKDIGLYLRCQNGETIRWLESVIASLDPLWDGCKLLVRKCEKQAKLIKSFLRLPICSTNLGLVCKALRGFNPEYHVQNWEFYSFQRKKGERNREGCCMVVGIPEDILVREILPNQRKVRYRLRTSFLRFFTPQGNLVTKHPAIDIVETPSVSSSIQNENTTSGAPNKTGGRKINVTSRAITIVPATVPEAGASAAQAREKGSVARHSDPSISEAAGTDLSDRETDAESYETKEQTDAETKPGSTEKKIKELPRWWNPELEEKRRWLRHLFNRAKNTKRNEDWLAHKQAQNEYKRLVRSSKHYDFHLIRE